MFYSNTPAIDMFNILELVVLIIQIIISWRTMEIIKENKE